GAGRAAKELKPCGLGATPCRDGCPVLFEESGSFVFVVALSQLGHGDLLAGQSIQSETSSPLAPLTIGAVNGMTLVLSSAAGAGLLPLGFDTGVSTAGTSGRSSAVGTGRVSRMVGICSVGICSTRGAATLPVSGLRRLMSSRTQAALLSDALVTVTVAA